MSASNLTELMRDVFERLGDEGLKLNQDDVFTSINASEAKLAMKLPWRMHDMENCTVVDSDGRAVASTYGQSFSEEENEIRARMVMSAVNNYHLLHTATRMLRPSRDTHRSLRQSHARLLEALKRTLAACECTISLIPSAGRDNLEETCAEARAAITAAQLGKETT